MTVMIRDEDHSPGPSGAEGPGLQRIDGGFVYEFHALGVACELWIESDNEDLAHHLGRLAEAEAWRIESRYGDGHGDSLIALLNSLEGEVVRLDDETADLIDFADRCFVRSGGRFDISSGWHRVTWKKPDISVPPGLSIDLAALCRGHLADSVMASVTSAARTPVMVDIDGDIAVSGPRHGGLPWRLAIGARDGVVAGNPSPVDLTNGALATHYAAAVDDMPAAITVVAASCREASYLATLAMSHGRQAAEFLYEQGITHWWVR